MPESVYTAAKRYGACPANQSYEGKTMDACTLADWAVQHGIPALVQIMELPRPPSPQAIVREAVEQLGASNF